MTKSSFTLKHVSHNMAPWFGHRGKKISVKCL